MGNAFYTTFKRDQDYSDEALEMLVEEAASMPGVFEGDDGICAGFDEDEELIKNLGINLKLTHATCFENAAFCGQTLVPHTDIIITDPLKKILSSFVTPRAYVSTSRKTKMAYLRSVMMSLKYQYPDTPVLGRMADWGLYITRSYDVRKIAVQNYHTSEIDNWAREAGSSLWKDVNPTRLIEIGFVPSDIAARLTMQDHYPKFDIELCRTLEKCFYDAILNEESNPSLPLLQAASSPLVRHSIWHLSKSTDPTYVSHKFPHFKRELKQKIPSTVRKEDIRGLLAEAYEPTHPD